MPSMEDTIMERSGWMADVPALKPALAAITRALSAHEKITKKAVEVAKDPHRTALGKQDVLRKFVAEHAHEVTRARKTVDIMRAKTVARKKNLMPPTPDPTNAASAVLRAEMRTMLRALKHGERMNLLLAPDADPLFLESVLETNNAMSGITDQVRDLVATSLIERRQPGAIAALEKIDEAIELVDVAAKVLFMTGTKAGDFPSDAVFLRFVETSVGGTGALESDIDRTFADLANAA
jgi:hypothetical protein